MTGLEKILHEIGAEAEAEAKAILDEARSAAEALRAEEAARAETQVKAIKAEADTSVGDILRAGESAKALARRQRLLAVKQDVLADTLAAAKAALAELPVGEYFALLCRLAAQNAQPGAGQMLLGAGDKARLPAGFAAQLAAVLPAGAQLTLAEETRPIQGGFVLKYGDIEENCSFDAIFDARREEFSDLVRPILFPQ